MSISCFVPHLYFYTKNTFIAIFFLFEVCSTLFLRANSTLFCSKRLQSPPSRTPNTPTYNYCCLYMSFGGLKSMWIWVCGRNVYLPSHSLKKIGDSLCLLNCFTPCSEMKTWVLRCNKEHFWQVKAYRCRRFFHQCCSAVVDVWSLINSLKFWSMVSIARVVTVHFVGQKAFRLVNSW